MVKIILLLGTMNTMVDVLGLQVVDMPMKEVRAFGWLNVPLEADPLAYSTALIEAVVAGLSDLNERIAAHADKDLRSISSINRAILRIGLVELDRGTMEPGVIIDDMLNLTRKYDGEESVPFINGVLGALARRKQQP